MKIVKTMFLLFIWSEQVFATTSISLDPKRKFLTLQTDSATAQLPLGLPKGFSLEGKPQYVGDNEFGIIVVEATEADVATTIIHAVDNKGKKLWSLDMEAFNPSTPLIEKDFVYLAGVGKVFKIERKTGKIIWTHSGLYENEKYKFNGAETIFRKDKQIIFSQKLQVNDQTGKVTERPL